MELVLAHLKNKKGQISIEFILIILFIVIYVASTINPLITAASSSTTETARIANAKIAAQKLTNIIESLGASQSEARITANIFIPENTGIKIKTSNPKKVFFESKMDTTKNPKPCETENQTNCCYGENVLICKGEIEISSNASLECPSNNSECKMFGKEMIQIKAEKNNETIKIVEIKYLPK